MKTVTKVLKCLYDNFPKVILSLLALDLGIGGFILGLVDKEMVTVGAMLMVLSFLPIVAIMAISEKEKWIV